MGCSDTWAAMLEQSDQAFRERNEHNLAADNAERHNITEMCARGILAYEGKPFETAPLQRMIELVGNAYIERDQQVSIEMGTRRTESQVASINCAADAADALANWSRGGDGSLAFAWLIEHWVHDLNRLERDIERHAEDLKRFARKGLSPEIPKAAKRRDRLEADFKEAEAIRRRIAWAAERAA